MREDHEKMARTFDQWAEAGRAEAMEDGHRDVVHQVVEKMGIGPGERILDLGCGNGWATRLLARRAPEVEAVGVDISPRMIARARARHDPRLSARYEVAAFESLPFPDGYFDRVFSMESIYYAVDLGKALRQIHRVLAPGGAAEVIIDFYLESPGTEVWGELVGVPMHYLSEAEWKRAFEAVGFRPVTTRRIVDRRGPGDPTRFTPTPWCPDWETWVSIHQCGSLWIHAVKSV